MKISPQYRAAHIAAQRLDHRRPSLLRTTMRHLTMLPTLLSLFVIACGPEVVVVNATSIDCQSAHVEADAGPCDREVTCDVCTDNGTGEVFWTCADATGETWTALDNDPDVDIAGEVACRCWQDHLDASVCEEQGLGWEPR